jgi:hypothetical protein
MQKGVQHTRNSASKMDCAQYLYLRMIDGAPEDCCSVTLFSCFSVARLRHPQHNSQLCSCVIGHRFCVHLPVSKLMWLLYRVLLKPRFRSIFRKSQNATFSFLNCVCVCLSVCLSTCTHVTTSILTGRFYWNFLLGFITITCRINPSFVKIGHQWHHDLREDLRTMIFRRWQDKYK